MTALHVAVQTGRADLVRHLLEKGANPEIADSNGRKAIDLILDVRAGNPTAPVNPAATQFSEPLLSCAAPRSALMTSDQIAESRQKAVEIVSDHARAWATSERFERIVLVFADLLRAVGEPVSALEVLVCCAAPVVTSP